jgi:hypothetical protein
MKINSPFSRAATSSILSIAIVTFAVAVFVVDTQVDVDIDIPVLYVAVVLMSHPRRARELCVFSHRCAGVRRETGKE